MAATDVMRSGLGGARLSAPVIVLIGMCSLIYFLDGLIHSILGPLAPDLARSLSLSNTELGPIFSANLIGQCIGLVVFPLLASRMGQRTVVLGSLVGFGLGQSASALSMGATDLFMWRLVTGLFLRRVPPELPRHRHGRDPRREARRGDHDVVHGLWRGSHRRGSRRRRLRRFWRMARRDGRGRRGLHRYGARRVVLAANPVARRRCAARRGYGVQRERIRHRVARVTFSGR